jgi:hypothetical protein
VGKIPLSFEGKNKHFGAGALRASDAVKLHRRVKNDVSVRECINVFVLRHLHTPGFNEYRLPKIVAFSVENE